MRTLTTIGALLCAATLTAGCSAVDGRAEPEDPTARDPAFDPCDDIPDDAIRAIGMDPATESRDILGVHQPGWNLCGWNDDSDALSVFSAIRPYTDVRLNGDYREFQDVEVGGEPGLMFHTVADPERVRCYVATGSTDGLLMVAFTVGHPTDGDPCPRARVAAAAFIPYARR